MQRQLQEKLFNIFQTLTLILEISDLFIKLPQVEFWQETLAGQSELLLHVLTKKIQWVKIVFLFLFNIGIWFNTAFEVIVARKWECGITIKITPAILSH